MKELTKEQKIELYDLIYPKSLEKDDDVKANDMTDQLKDREALILLWSDIKKISDWMIANQILNCKTRQKNILQIIHQYNEGWKDEEELEEDLSKLFLDKRHKPKNVNNFINSIDNKLYNRLRRSISDAECRRYLREHLQKQLTIYVYKE